MVAAATAPAPGGATTGATTTAADDNWPVRRLSQPITLHVARLGDVGMPEGTSLCHCRGSCNAPGHGHPAACQRYFLLTAALLSWQGAALRQSSTQGLYVVDQAVYSDGDKADSVDWLARLRKARPGLVVVEHKNTTVWAVMRAMHAADPARLRLRHVKYAYAVSPESLNAARMACSRLNATMIDASLEAEARQEAGFVLAEEALVDGVRWVPEVMDMTDAQVLTDWLPRMALGTVGLEQFTKGGLLAYQADVAAAWPVISWTPDATSQSAINANRKAFLRHLANDSLVFGLSHTEQDESDMVQDTSSDSKILTISEGSLNVALLSSFRTETVPKQKPMVWPPQPLSSHFVAFMMHDGDGLDFELGGETPGMMSGFWDTQDRGRVPIGWGLSGQFRDLAQPVVESLYADAARNGADGYDDFFLQDGYGYFHPGSFSTDARELDAARTGRAAAALHLTTAAFFADTEDPHAWQTAERDLEPYGRLGNFSAIQMWRQDDGAFSGCYISNNRSERGAIKWLPDGTPIMQLRASLWSGHAGASAGAAAAQTSQCPPVDINRKRPVQPCPKPWFYQTHGPGGAGCVQGCPSMQATRNSTTGRCFCGHPGTPIDKCLSNYGMQCIAGQCVQCSAGPTCTGPRGDWCPGIGQCLTTAGLATLLNNQTVSPTSSAGYSLVHVQGDTKECSQSLACLTKLKHLLAPHVQIVGPSVLAALVRRHVRTSVQLLVRPPIEMGAKVLPKTRAAYSRIGSEIVRGDLGRRAETANSLELSIELSSPTLSSPTEHDSVQRAQDI